MEKFDWKKIDWVDVHNELLNCDTNPERNKYLRSIGVGDNSICITGLWNRSCDTHSKEFVDKVNYFYSS